MSEARYSAGGEPATHFSGDAELDLLRRIADASAIVCEADFTGTLSFRAAINRYDSQAEMSDRLRHAVEEAASRSADSMAALERAVRDFTAAIRDEGTPPEYVLIRLKGLIHSQTFPPLGAHASDWNGETLRQNISTWCIQEYFKEKSA